MCVFPCVNGCVRVHACVSLHEHIPLVSLSVIQGSLVLQVIFEGGLNNIFVYADTKGKTDRETSVYRFDAGLRISRTLCLVHYEGPEKLYNHGFLLNNPLTVLFSPPLLSFPPFLSHNRSALVELLGVGNLRGKHVEEGGHFAFILLTSVCYNWTPTPHVISPASTYCSFSLTCFFFPIPPTVLLLPLLYFLLILKSFFGRHAFHFITSHCSLSLSRNTVQYVSRLVKIKAILHARHHGTYLRRYSKNSSITSFIQFQCHNEQYEIRTRHAR